MTTYTLDELLALSWRNLPQGSKEMLAAKLVTVDSFLAEGETRLPELETDVQSADISLENSALLTEYQTLKLHLDKALKMKRTITRELTRRGVINA